MVDIKVKGGKGEKKAGKAQACRRSMGRKIVK